MHGKKGTLRASIMDSQASPPPRFFPQTEKKGTHFLSLFFYSETKSISLNFVLTVGELVRR